MLLSSHDLELIELNELLAFPMHLSPHVLEVIKLFELLRFTKCLSSHGLQLVGLIELLGFTKFVCSHVMQYSDESNCWNLRGLGAPMVHVFPWCTLLYTL